MSNRLVARGLAVLAFSLFAAYSAEATSIRLSDDGGLTFVTINDGDVTDASGVSDVVTFNGSIGVWKVNITTGITLFSDPTEPYLQLTSLNTSSKVGGTLMIWFTDTGYGPTGDTAYADIGGTTNGSVAYDTFQSTTNDPFIESSLLTSQAFGAGAFSGTASGLLPSVTGPYSLTQKVTIVHDGKEATSFSGILQVVSVPDGGSTIGLLGLALLAVGLFRRNVTA